MNTKTTYFLFVFLFFSLSNCFSQNNNFHVFVTGAPDESIPQNAQDSAKAFAEIHTAVTNSSVPVIPPTTHVDSAQLGKSIIAKNTAPVIAPTPRMTKQDSMSTPRQKPARNYTLSIPVKNSNDVSSISIKEGTSKGMKDIYSKEIICKREDGNNSYYTRGNTIFIEIPGGDVSDKKSRYFEVSVVDTQGNTSQTSNYILP